MKIYIPSLFVFFLLLASCTQEDEARLTAFGVYCEMVANDAKPMALHQPMDGALIDQYWEDYQEVANQYGVQLHKEDDFPVTQLFPAELTEGKTVILIYKGNRLEQYQMWKKDWQAYQGDDPKEQEAFSRRFGRILGYGTQGMNELLSKNINFKTLSSFSVNQQLTHLYYANVQEAINFYEKTIGLNKLDSNQFQISQDASIVLHHHNEAHPEGQTKSTAIALLTDQLPKWYLFVQQQGMPIKYTYKPKDGGPHDGFVAIDPGGYLLEFEQFKQHPENELFMTILPNAPRVGTQFEELNFYGSITWTYHKDLLKMQQFYEEMLGFQMVADQGWTKIYQTSPTGFIGLVDECRGMEDYADTKGVELEWGIDDFEGFDSYASQKWQSFNYEDQTFMGPEKYFYHIGKK